MFHAYMAAAMKLMEYAEYKEHQQDIGRPVMNLKDWMSKRKELDELLLEYDHGKITASDLDCQATWDLEYLLGA